MMIPCFLTIRDLVTWPAAMVAHVQRLGLRPVLCDHGSTYWPCRQWLDQQKAAGVEVQRYRNDGCYGFFNRRDHQQQEGWFLVSDSDLDLSALPDDTVAVMQAAFEANPWANKVGVSLEIEDIPLDVPTRAYTFDCESKYWTQRSPDGHWIAGVGATFALYHRRRKAKDSEDTTAFYRAVRLDRPYTARHWPWYVKPAEIDAEYRYYLDRINGSPAFSRHLLENGGAA